jgi:hypothetical protein
MILSLKLIVAVVIGALIAGGGGVVTYSLVNAPQDNAATYSYPGA